MSARSDLYSLGCMLYEMVCGRPPFIGDDSVAIIAQHLNTPPVAPSWHRTDVPPGLEALIVRLLEKDPAKRPESAAEVRAALASLGSPLPQGEGQGEGSSARSTADNPLYQRVFVGREQELRQPHAAFDAALSGQGALLLEHYPDAKPKAVEHLDFAITEFRDMKMQPSLERALKHKGLLHA